MIRYIALVLVAANIATAAPPGAPVIDWADRNYALVEVSPDAVAYERLVKRKDRVEVNLSWSVYTGEPGDTAYVLFGDRQVWVGEAAGKRASVHVSSGGKHDVRVKLCNADGCSVSAPVTVKIADTDGAHLDPLPYDAWLENNRPAEPTGKVVGAYFVEWGVYGRDFPADKVPVPNLTHLLYGFVPMCGGDGINDSLKSIAGSFEALQRSCAGRDDFKLAVHDPWAAVQKPQKGVTAWSEPYKGNFGQLMAIKKAHPHLRVLPSIGGWTLSDPFYHMHDASARRTFVESAREFLQTWKLFDGLDVDWEFPGGKGANPLLGDAERDRETYALLLEELRLMLDELQTETNRTYELTSAIGAGDDKIAVVDYGRAHRSLDRIFLMSYDFKGAWSTTELGHQTALYAPSWRPDEPYTADGAVRQLLAQGAPADKIVLGVAMYGRGWTGVTGYADGNPFTGTATGPVPGTWEDGVVDYRELRSAIDAGRYAYAYDSTAKGAYAFDETAGALVSFDSADSILDKGKYARELGLGGLFAWEIDADNGDLLNAMHAGLKPAARRVEL
ncbi:chitinase [Olene mendosa nucleopolyhedrovirus]|uniref:Chitinase n=1 Tax=Olene mendosa nucleopolyhedrovirus TaxID=2933796 RepID=A0AAX3AWH3_9ABAC|nr:chitinase [Olene mendosa nucleopolyhedrovirus]UOQ18844.1 chitinase [Olene mendosa nucleopolyhedrovirus]